MGEIEAVLSYSKATGLLPLQVMYLIAELTVIPEKQ